MEKYFEICGRKIGLGERSKVNLDVARLYDFTEMSIPIEVIRGKEDGPKLFVCAAIHGDEINGVEIIKRLLRHKSLKKIRGTLVAIPIVNVFGFNNKSRYLPDRRDLNRYFPGNENGSMTSQLAHKFMNEVVRKCTHGIDLHTGAIHRANLPQIRACLDSKETNRLAHAFNVPVLIDSNVRDNSLREAARELDIPMLLFEGGEALRFNETVIRSGLHGILSVMKEISMLPESSVKDKKEEREAFIARNSFWVRASCSGTLNVKTKLGDKVEKDKTLGIISDPFGAVRAKVTAPRSGIVIGNSTLPLLNRGDAIFHIATFENLSDAYEEVELYKEYLLES